MENKLIVTFHEDETPLSDLEKGLTILKSFPIITTNKGNKQENRQTLEVYLKNSQNKEFDIFPQSNSINYLGFDKIKESYINFEGDHVKVSTQTNEGRYNFSFYSQKSD